MMTLQTEKGYTIRQLSVDEVNELKKGDSVVVCTCFDPPRKLVLDDAIVVRPIFMNFDADEPGYEVETNIGFFDKYSFFEVF